KAKSSRWFPVFRECLVAVWIWKGNRSMKSSPDLPEKVLSIHRKVKMYIKESYGEVGRVMSKLQRRPQAAGDCENMNYLWRIAVKISLSDNDRILDCAIFTVYFERFDTLNHSRKTYLEYGKLLPEGIARFK
ncbi:hypothetical protein STEG23_026864, partial [Scotinomys teguina]